MHRYSLVRLGQNFLCLVASFAVVGCTQIATGMNVPLSELESAIPEKSSPEPDSPVSSEKAALIAATPEAQQIEFEVCSQSPDWTRLSEADQLKQLRQNPRYGDAIEAEPLKSLFQGFWSHQAISFTTYGLSARIEPLNFSGLGEIADTFSTCYEGSGAEKINGGQLAEVWLMGHQPDTVQWDGDRYLMTVQPIVKGVQLIQFPRQETQTSLPLTIVTKDGTEVSVKSGDW
ncbi:MAG: hypothetical protein QNJ46_19260 [Leptolyngbyaceae cyanobacterium MO_188.B28]|nr:hypothetical protein [Leptolyngbyaceae cyanobacterium MO_188.B28]